MMYKSNRPMMEVLLNCRSASDRGPRPLSNLANFSRSSLNGSKEKVCPYSIVSKEMENKMDDHEDKLLGSKSMSDFPPSDRYRKLEEDSFVYGTSTVNCFEAASTTSTSSLTTGTSPPSTTNHKDSMARIREDISRYKCQGLSVEEKGGEASSTLASKDERTIPKVSSKWSQFMCEEDSEEEEEEEGDHLVRELGSGVVTSGYTVAKYSTSIATKQ